MNSLSLDCPRFAPPSKDWVPGRFREVFDKCYNWFPRQTRNSVNSAVSLMLVDQNSHEKIIPPVPEIVFRLVRRSSISHSRVDLGEGPTVLSGREGSLYLAPAGAQAEWHSEGDHQLLMLSAPAKKVEALFQSTNGPDMASLNALFGREIHDPAATSLMESIWRASDADGPVADMMTEGLLITLLAHLAGVADAAGDAAQKGPEAPLSSSRIAEVVAFIDTRLESAVSLDEMAAVCNLSSYHFSRRFRATTGVSPHRFIILRRVEAGRRMLADTALSIAEVSFACGFSSQSHFTRAFKEKLGATPGAYRAEVGA
ncbi:MAG: AraC family transcriptional regulator [Pseudomonadota bacterium]